MEAQTKQKVSGLYAALVWFFLISSLLAVIASIYFTFLNSRHQPSLYEYLCIPLYVIDVFAFYLLLKPNPNPLGLKIILSTSIIYCLAYWYNGIVEADVFRAFGSADFYLFATSGTILPFIDVILIYIANKKLTKKHVNGEENLTSSDGSNSNKKALKVIIFISLNAILLPVILFILFILSLEFGPGGFHI